MRFASSWSDCVEYFVDSWQCYNGIALYYTEPFLSQNAVQYHSIKIFFLFHCIKMGPDCSQGNMLSFTLLAGCVLPVAKGELWEGLQGSWHGDILSLPLTHLAGISEPLKTITPGNIEKCPSGDIPSEQIMVYYENALLTLICVCCVILQHGTVYFSIHNLCWGVFQIDLYWNM